VTSKIKSALGNIEAKYDLEKKTLFEDGITPAEKETAELLEAVKTVGFLAEVVAESKIYVDLVDELTENLWNEQLEAPEGIEDNAIDVDAVAEGIEEKLGKIEQHHGAHMYFSNELERIRNIPDKIREAQANYESICSDLRKEANAYLKETITDKEDLQFTSDEITRILLRIDNARSFTAGGLIKPKPIIKDATYKGLKEFLSTLQMTAIAIQRGNPREEYEFFVDLMREAKSEREVNGPDDPDYRSYVELAGKRLEKARALIKAQGKIDERLAPLMIVYSMTEADFDQDLIKKYTGWSQELERKGTKSRWS
jgi:hypothetical protein